MSTSQEDEVIITTRRHNFMHFEVIRDITVIITKYPSNQFNNNQGRMIHSIQSSFWCLKRTKAGKFQVISTEAAWMIASSGCWTEVALFTSGMGLKPVLASPQLQRDQAQSWQLPQAKQQPLGTDHSEIQTIVQSSLSSIDKKAKPI